MNSSTVAIDVKEDHKEKGVQREDDEANKQTVMPWDAGDLGLDVDTYLAQLALAVAQPPLLPMAAAAPPNRNLCKTLGEGCAIISGICCVVGSWLLCWAVSIAALVLNPPCEKQLALWMLLNAFACIFSRITLSCKRRFPRSLTAKLFHCFGIAGTITSVLTGCALTYSIPIAANQRTCPDWLYYSSFLVATINLVWTVLACSACIHILHYAFFRQPAVRVLRHVDQYSSTNAAIIQQPIVQNIRSKISLLSDRDREGKEAENDLSPPHGTMPQFRLFDTRSLTPTPDPTNAWKESVQRFCFRQSCSDLSAMVVSYIEECVWVVSRGGLKSPHFYDICTYNPYTGLVRRIPTEVSAPLRFNAVIRALPRNGLILVLGGLKAHSTNELHLSHRVDAFNVRTRQWERFESLKLPDDRALLAQPPPQANGVIVDAVVINGTSAADESLLVLGPIDLFSRTRICRQLFIADKRWLSQDEVNTPVGNSTLATHPSKPNMLFSFGGATFEALTKPLPQFSSISLPTWRQQMDRQFSMLINNIAANTSLDARPLPILINNDNTLDTTTSVNKNPMATLPDMRLARLNPTVIVTEKGFVVAGGNVDLLSFAVPHVESYSFLTNQWTKLPDLPCLLPTIPTTTMPHSAIQFGTLYNSLHYLPFGFSLPLVSNHHKNRKEWQPVLPDAFRADHYQDLLSSVLLTL